MMPPLTNRNCSCGNFSAKALRRILTYSRVDVFRPSRCSVTTRNAVSGPELGLSMVENPAPLPVGSPMLAISVSISFSGIISLMTSSSFITSFSVSSMRVPGVVFTRTSNTPASTSGKSSVPMP